MRHIRRSFIVIFILSLLVLNLPIAVKNSNAQVRATYNNGALGLGQLLRRLQTTASAMHTGAHPDDEDTALIARLARGDNARVVYLALNRGEGGQNIIGNELFEPLGVIRTEELLQSRRLDGGEQLFTRVMDYGFSKTRAEAAEKWTEQTPLADMVRAIRLYRPLVIISRFSGTPADGHGHHQLAGYLTPIAFKAAADPNQFPEQLKEGLHPWQAKKLYAPVFPNFREEDFKDVGQLIARLKNSNEPVTKYLISKFDKKTLGLIEEHKDGSLVSSDEKNALISEFNKALNDSSLYEKNRFQNIKLSADTERLLKQNSEMSNVVFLNRMLLEDALPNEILRDGNIEKRGYSRTTVTIQTGEYDSLFGRSYFEIAMEGRSQHKSQEMGLLEIRGAQASGERLLERINITGDDKGIFDGLDVSIKGIASLSGLQQGLIDDELNRMQTSAAKALNEYDPFAPEKIIPHLAEGLNATRLARLKLYPTGLDNRSNIDFSTGQYPKIDIARVDANFLLAQKEKEFSEALQRAVGVVVDALTDTETVAANESLTVSVRVFAPANSNVQITSINLRTPNGWKSQEIEEPKQEPGNTFRPRTERSQKAAFFRVTVPENEKPTQPYWLQEPRNGYVFNWADDAPKNKPFADALVSCEVKLNIGGVDVIATKNAQYRYADEIRGEIRRELNVVPALSVSLDSKLIISTVSTKPEQHRVAVRVTNNAMKAMTGVVSLRLSNGWKSEPANVPVSFTKKGERTAAVFNVTVPANTKTDAYKIAAQVSSDGKMYDQEMRVVAYSHIQTHRYYTNAETNVRVIDLKVAPVNVGYIMGSGDAVPDAIKRMGLDVTMLGEEDLASGDLSRFDTIVIGIRASQVRPDFVANNGRLLDFVRNGGTLIVQYQQQEYVNLKLSPFPAQMASRVTDENAKVTILQPQHAAFNYPNKITDEDFKDWVQERSLYNFTTFDSQYTPLLESHDAGEAEQKGGEVYAEIGKGKFVYTSYAWFRQLPNGVPGAYRLFANLLSLPKAAKK